MSASDPPSPPPTPAAEDEIRPKHAQAIGYVAAYWSLVEFETIHTLRILLRVTIPISFALLSETSLLLRANMIQAILGLTKEEELIEKWGNLWKRIDTIRSERNDVVHAQWVVSSLGHTTLRTKAKGKLKIELRPIDSNKTFALAVRIRAAATDVLAFNRELLKSTAPKFLSTHHGLPIDFDLLRPNRAPAPPKKPKARKLSSAQKRLQNRNKASP